MKYIALAAATAVALVTPAIADELPLNAIVSSQGEAAAGAAGAGAGTTAVGGFAIGGAIGTATITAIAIVGSVIVITLVDEDGNETTITTTTST